MARFYRDLCRLLIEAGWAGKGDHEIWYRPITRDVFVIDRGTRSRPMANAVLKDAGLPMAF